MICCPSWGVLAPVVPLIVRTRFDEQVIQDRYHLVTTRDLGPVYLGRTTSRCPFSWIGDIVFQVRPLLLLCALTLLLGTVVPLADAGPAQSETSPSTGPAVSGLILHDGVPVNGARVVAQVWPTASALESAPADQVIPMLPVARGLTGADGVVELIIDPSKIPADFITVGKQIDLDLLISDGANQVTWSLSLSSVPGPPTGSLSSRMWVDSNSMGTSSAHDVPAVRIDLGSGRVATSSVTYDDEDTRFTVNSDPAMTATVMPYNQEFEASWNSVASSSYTPSRPPCGTIPGEITYGQYGRVIRAQGVSGAVTTSVDFNSGTSHTLGIATELAGGGFKAGGSATISASSGGTDSYAGIRWVRNRYNYRKYTTGCAGFPKTVTHRPISIYSFHETSTGANVKYYAHCSDRRRTGTLWKSAGQNYTVNGGVNFKGFGLNAQAGWNSDTKIAWHFAGWGRLCGSTSAGWVTSPEAVARP